MKKLFILEILVVLLATAIPAVYAQNAVVDVSVWDSGWSINPMTAKVGNGDTVTWNSQTTIFVPPAAEIEIDVPPGGPFPGGFKQRGPIGVPIVSPLAAWPVGVNSIKYNISIFNSNGTLIRFIDPFLDRPIPTATAVEKTIKIPIPGSGGFTIDINNPTSNDIHVYMSAAHWTGPVPEDTITGILDGAVLIPAGGTVRVEFPIFQVGAGAKPGIYPILIQWTVQETGEVITTDPYVNLYMPTVGGINIPIDKSGLLAPYIGLVSAIIVATGATAICARRIKRTKEK